MYFAVLFYAVELDPVSPDLCRGTIYAAAFRVVRTFVALVTKILYFSDVRT